MFNKFPAVQTAPPSTSILLLPDAKQHLRRDDADDDTYITSLIGVVESHVDGVDGILGLMLIQQSWQETANGFPPGDCFELDLMPVTSITSIQYYDDDNALQTLTTSDYAFHNGVLFSYVKLNTDKSWPSTYDRDDAVIVTYQGGYGTASTDVPTPILQAAKLLLGHYYENRESVIVGPASRALPMAVESLLRPYIRSKF
jgi:uncharacterized phiE125 gp8 family phage protein